MSGSPTERQTANSGCGTIAIVALVAAVLIVFNGAVVSTLYTLLVRYVAFLTDPRVGFTIVLAGPMVLTFAEYWLYDRAVEWWQRSRETHD